MYHQKLFFISLSLLSFISCRSQEFQERAARLEATLAELNEETSLLGSFTVSQIEETRKDVLLLYLEEGEYQYKKVGVPGHPHAQEKASSAFECVKRLYATDYKVYDQSLEQEWPALSDFAWNRHREIWNICKVAIPPLWPWTVGETTFSLFFDIFFGWESKKAGEMKPEPLPKRYLEAATAKLEKLASLNIKDITEEASRKMNVRVEMVYELSGTEKEIDIMSYLVNSEGQLPGDRGSQFLLLSKDSYQVLWNDMITRWTNNDAYEGYVASQSFETDLSHGAKIVIRAQAIGHVSPHTLLAFSEEYTWSEDDPHPMMITVERFDPQQREK